MNLYETLKPVIRMVMLVSYAIYVLLGILLCVVGGMYASGGAASVAADAGVGDQVPDVSTTAVAIVCIASGVGMLLCGGAAIFATLQRKWIIMAVVMLIDIILFVTLLTSCMVGFVISMEVNDPVQNAVSDAFKTIPQKQDTWEATIMPVLTRGTAGESVDSIPVTCRDFNLLLDGPGGVKVTRALGVPCRTRVPGNCTLAQVADNLVKKCEACWVSWKQQYASNIKDQLWPATFTVFALFG